MKKIILVLVIFLFQMSTTGNTIAKEVNELQSIDTRNLLVEAIEHNNLPMLDKVLSKFPNMLEAKLYNYPNRDYCDLGLYLDKLTYGTYTPLHLAVRLKKNEVVEFLVSKGSDVNLINDFGLSPLCIAVRESNLDMIDLLLKHKANIFYESKTPIRGTYLNQAAQSKECGVIKFLIKKGLHHLIIRGRCFIIPQRLLQDEWLLHNTIYHLLKD